MNVASLQLSPTKNRSPVIFHVPLVSVTTALGFTNVRDGHVSVRSAPRLSVRSKDELPELLNQM